MSSGPPPVIQDLSFNTNQAEATLERWSSKLEAFIQKFGGALNIVIGSGNSDAAFGTLKTQAESIGGAVSKANAVIKDLNETPGPEKIIKALKAVEETLRVTLPAGADVAAKAINNLNGILSKGTDSVEAGEKAVKDLRELYLSLGLTIEDNKAKILNFQAQIGRTVAGRANGTISGPIADADIKSFQTSIGSLEAQNKDLANINGIVSKSIASTKDELKLLSDAEKQAAKDTLALANAEEDRLKRVRAAQDALLQSRNKQQVGIEKEQTSIDTNRPFLERGATADEANAQTQLAKATQLVADANKRVSDSRKGGSDQQKAADARALATAIQAQKDATLALAAAQQKLQVARNSTASKDQIKQANDLVSATSNQAKATLGLANTNANVADKFRAVKNEAGGSHQQMLAILATSRFLPGPLGGVVSGLGLMSGALGTVAGAGLSAIGVLVALGVQAVAAGGQFNTSLNKIRAQAEGLGLTVDEIKTLDAILSQTGGSVENFSVLLRNIKEAIIGIGPNAERSTRLLKIALGPDLQLQGAKTIDIFRAFLATLSDTQKEATGLSQIVSTLAGRNFDEVKGRAKDITEQFDEFNKKIKESNNFGVEAQKVAKDYSKSLSELELAWQSLANKMKLPIIATVIIN